MSRQRFQSTGSELTEDFSPLESIINIVDAFLVCMVGVLSMLVIYYNVNLTQVATSDISQDMTEVGDITGESQDITANENYERMGSVYVDSRTGQMYVVTENEDSGNGPR